MSYGIGQFGIPGVSPAAFNETTELYWGGDESRIEILRKDALYDSTMLDAGAQIPSTVRAGLLVGALAANGRLKQWDPEATDGTQHLFGVNPHENRMIDQFGQPVGRFPPVVVKAPLKASALLILGDALKGHDYEFLARKALWEMGCRLDDDAQGFLAGYARRTFIVTATGNIETSQNGGIFICKGSGARTLTLPAIKPGLVYEFRNFVNQNLTINTQAADKIVHVNSLVRDSLTFSTASQLIGGYLRFEAVLDGADPIWVVQHFTNTVTAA